MLSQDSKNRIGDLYKWDSHPTEFERFTTAVVELIQERKITHCDQIREYAKEQNETELEIGQDEQDRLAFAVDCIGYTMKVTRGVDWI